MESTNYFLINKIEFCEIFFLLLTTRKKGAIITPSTNAMTETSNTENRSQRVRKRCEPHIRVCANNTPEQRPQRVRRCGRQSGQRSVSDIRRQSVKAGSIGAVCIRMVHISIALCILVGKTCSARYSGSKVIAFAVIQVAPRVLCSRPV